MPVLRALREGIVYASDAPVAQDTHMRCPWVMPHPWTWASQIIPTEPTTEWPAMPKDQTPQAFSLARMIVFRLKEGLRYRFLLEPRALESLSGARIAEIDVRTCSSDMHPRPDAVL